MIILKMIMMKMLMIILKLMMMMNMLISMTMTMTLMLQKMIINKSQIKKPNKQEHKRKLMIKLIKKRN